MALMLRPKQIQTFQRLIANHRFLDRSQAGTGKTPTQCALTGYVMRITPEEILTLIGEKKISTRASLTNNSFLQPMSARIITGGKYNCRVIWIQPSSLMKKNRQEILDWNPDLHPDQVKLIKGTATQKRKISLDQNTLVWVMTAEAYAKHIVEMRQKFPDIIQVICDEPHLYYRGWNSKRTQAFVQGTPDYCRISFMTATPTPRGKLSSAYTYCHMIQKDYYHSYDFYLQQHAILDDYGTPQEWINHEVLQKFLLHYSICWTAKDMYGDVDEVILRDILPMEPTVETIYRSFEQAGLAEIKNIVLEAKTGGTDSLRVRQMLAHPNAIKLPCAWDLKGKPTKFEEAKIFEGLTPKLERILEYAEEGEPFIVFGTFTAEIEAIAETLRNKKYRVGVINGEVSQQRRNKIDQEFRAGNLDVLVCSAATAAFGFNWGHVNTVIFHSLNYGDDEFLQAVARAKRGIRTELLRIICLEYENTADQYVMWAVHHNSRSSNAANPDNPVIYFPKVKTEAKENNFDDILAEFMEYKEVGEKMIA